MSDASFNTWRAKYDGMDVSEAKRLRALEEENRQLKQIVADQAFDIQMLRAVNRKNGELCSAARGGGLAAGGYGASQRRACRALGVSLATCRYVSRRGDGGVIRQRLNALAEEQPRFGYRYR